MSDMGVISDMSPVLSGDIDAICGADLKVQQGLTEMLKKQVRIVLPLK